MLADARATISPMSFTETTLSSILSFASTKAHVYDFELIKKETNKTFKVIITGGFANLFVNSLRQKATIDKDITLKGLIKSAKLNSL